MIILAVIDNGVHQFVLPTLRFSKLFNPYAASSKKPPFSKVCGVPCWKTAYHSTKQVLLFSSLSTGLADGNKGQDLYSVQEV